MEYKKEINKSKVIASELCCIINKNNNELLDIHSRLSLKKTKNCTKLCRFYIKGEECSWNKRGKCKFAHNFMDLDEFNRQKIIELGLQSYYHLYNNKKLQKMNNSFYDYLNTIKISEELYLKEYFLLHETKIQYIDLYKYFITLQKELIALKNINDTYVSNKIKESNFDNETQIIKNITNIKTLIDDTIGCKICYRSIITTDDIHKHDDPINYLQNTDKLITLKCGHSICNQCHFNIVANEYNIYIKCPICRENNELKNTKPNYLLNELIFKIKIIFSEYIKIVDIVDKQTQNIQKNKYITKNITSLNNKYSHIILPTKSNECPW